MGKRLILSLIVGISLVSTLFTVYQVRAEHQSRRDELEKRAEIIGFSLQDTVEMHMANDARQKLHRIVEQFANRERLAGIAVYDSSGAPIAVTSTLAQRFPVFQHPFKDALATDRAQGRYVDVENTPLHVYSMPLHRNDDVIGSLAIIHDATFIEDQMQGLWRDTFLRVLAQMLIIVFTTVLIVRWSIHGPIERAAQWMRALRTGRTVSSDAVPDFDLFPPLAREVETFAVSLQTARAAAEKEARMRVTAELAWTADRLSVYVRGKLKRNHLFVVSNREPYIHQRKGDVVEVSVPASGLVTALEPILRACDGTWVAHGSGAADKEVVDPNNCLRVPPEDPKYTLKRVWLTREEEDGYYFGFANEGLWPLCHIAHTRPIFRAGDWKEYQKVNQKFADALLEEMEATESPVVLLQDYHFALLPRIIKKSRPDARIAIFWHIPWPNPEAFGICPWQAELLDGLLGADLIGFHIQAHCNNFLETVDHVLESRIEWERFAVQRESHFTMVRPYPISVVFPEPPSSTEKVSAQARALITKTLGALPHSIGIGVDRVDYTKGIIERFLAVERLLEDHPSYVGEFSFIQIGSPSRMHIKSYQDLMTEVAAQADRINKRFQSRNWKPIIFLDRQHSHEEIQPYYQAADVCMVTSLHDGMNLVAKEFVASRVDEQGVLILSQFTGASCELHDAIMVNPYDVEQMAESLHMALRMDPEEQQSRMHDMRKTLKEQNVYRWAGTLIADLCDVRIEPAKPTAESMAPKYAAIAS